MHSISSYCIRCYDREKEVPNTEDKYLSLGYVGKIDTYNVIKDCLIGLKTQAYTLIEESKQIYVVSELEFDDNTRIVKGILESGKYGTKNDIINIETKQIDYQKLQNHAEMVKYYFLFFIPKDQNEGIALLQSFGNLGIKTIIYDIISDKFKNLTNLNLQMNPLAYDKAFNEWKDGIVQEFKLNKFIPPTDLATAVNSYAHGTTTSNLIIKATKSNFGRLKDYFRRGTKEAELVEVITRECSTVKALVQVGDKKRTFTVNKYDTPRQICKIELNESDVNMVDGNPTYESIDNFCLTLLEEYKDALYPFQAGTT